MILTKNQRMVEIDLSHNKKLFIFVVTEQIENSKRESVIDLAITLNDTIICYGICEVEVFKNELSLFDKGDNNNEFLQIVQKKDHSNHINFSLRLILENEEVYFNKSESLAIANKIQNLLSRINTNSIISSYTNIRKSNWNKLLYFYLNK